MCCTFLASVCRIIRSRILCELRFDVPKKCLNLRPNTVDIPFVMTRVAETPSNVNIAFLYNSNSCQRKLLIVFLMEKLLLFQNSDKSSDMRNEDKQCTCTYVLMRLRITIFAMKKRLVLRFVSVPYLSSMQSACALLYFHLWPVRLYSNFPHYFINVMILGQKLPYI